MDIRITPAPLTGAVQAPPSKSAAHRAAICAMLAMGESVLSPVQATDDMMATMAAATALGAVCELSDDTMTIIGMEAMDRPERAEIDCNESGSTLRFFIPIAAALGIPTLFLGRGQLPQRPLTPLVDCLRQNGVSCTLFDGTDGKILETRGRLQSGVFTLPGDISSQYITGLLFALPLLEGDSEIRLTSPLQSRGYVGMTLQALEKAGVQVKVLPGGGQIPGGQRYHAGAARVEGDYSGAAFWLCAGALGEPVRVDGLQRRYSLQGDRAVVDILQRFGANVTFTQNSVMVAPGKLRGCDIDVMQIPDLAPILAVVAACAEGESRITGAARLRLKESDRLHTITAGLRILGADVEEHADSLTIRGKAQLNGGTVDSFGDHRIAMAMSVAAIRCREPVTVIGAHCVAKSYPAFYRHYAFLGGNCDVL